MPSLTNNPIFTATDVKYSMVAALNSDAYIQSILLNSAGQFAPFPAYAAIWPSGRTQTVVLPDDPQPGDIGGTENTRLVFTLATEGESDMTLGRESGGSALWSMTFAMILYRYEGETRTFAGKDAIEQMTSIARMAVMRQSQGATSGSGPKLWFASDFRRIGRDVSTYYTPKNCRMSVTYVELLSRIPYT